MVDSGFSRILIFDTYDKWDPDPLVSPSAKALYGHASGIGGISSTDTKSLIANDGNPQAGAGTLAIPSPPEGVKDLPVVGAQIHELWNYAFTNLRAALKEVAPHLKPLAGPVLAFAGSAGLGTLKFVASVVLSGFLFHYGPGLVAAIKGIQARLVTQRSQDFVALAGLTIRTIAQGVIGVAVLQSLLAGIGLKLAGVPHAGVLAFFVLVLAILQIGSAIVLLPVIIWIWATKDFALALPLTIYLLVVGFADNILKPILMGRGLNTPMLVIFIGVLGGMLAHGILGLFVGPIILAVTWELTMAWIREERDGCCRNRCRAEHEKDRRRRLTVARILM